MYEMMMMTIVMTEDGNDNDPTVSLLIISQV